MIYGIGTDLLRVSRMQAIYQRHGQRLCDRILHPAELQRLPPGARAGNFLAKCFAVKEAMVKAMGTGFRGVGYREIGWQPDALGKPELLYSPRLRGWLDAHGIGAGFVTLSDEADLIQAVVVLERCQPGDSAASARAGR